MNKFDKIKKELKLKQVISIYENSSMTHYLEVHNVVNNTLMPGEILGEDVFAEFCQKMNVRKKQKKKFNKINVGIIPFNLFYFQENQHGLDLIFYFEKGERELLFKEENKFKNGKYYIPNVLYFYKSKSIYIYAFNKWEGQNTKLYHIAMPNVANDCSVCMGNVKRDDFSDLTSIMNQTHESFWNSYFREWRITDENQAMERWNNNRYIFNKTFYKGKLHEQAKIAFPSIVFNGRS